MNRLLVVVGSIVLLSLLISSTSACGEAPKTTQPTVQNTTTVQQITTTVSPATTTVAPTTTTARPTTTKPVITTPPIKVIFEDNFNSEVTGVVPSKWTVTEPTDTDVSIDDSIYLGTNGKSAKLQDNSPAGTPNMLTKIGTQTGRFWYEVSIRLAQTNQITGAAYLSDSKTPGGRFGIDNLGVSVTFWNDGYIKYNDNDNDLASWKNVQTYEVDKWYIVKVLVDVPNQKISLYIDDELKVTDAKFRYPVTSLDQISFGGRVELPASTFWIDNVLIKEAQ
jgi:hypothetical protein